MIAPGVPNAIFVPSRDTRHFERRARRMRASTDGRSHGGNLDAAAGAHENVSDARRCSILVEWQILRPLLHRFSPYDNEVWGGSVDLFERGERYSSLGLHFSERSDLVKLSRWLRPGSSAARRKEDKSTPVRLQNHSTAKSWTGRTLSHV